MDHAVGASDGLPTEHQLQLYLWQKASFLDTGHGPSDRADSLRLQLAQLSYYSKTRYKCPIVVVPPPVGRLPSH